ncbi:hypothetical protein FRC04_001196 [Tulasnella sp. 424]|nr:hypothetical protein FRC04_001196 [Tulasnella sp. 424]KAG8975784.1 hypothetical protein FRC05_004994 [Tulasnella sp. 425]
MSRTSSSGLSLGLSPTLDEPTTDPGLRMKLKRSYSGQDCFDKFHPYLLWLRSFISRNKWVSIDIVDQFQDLWDTYTEAESELGKITALKEFFSQQAHAEVAQLWKRYRALRKEIEDMATQRVTMKAAWAADREADIKLRGKGWTSDASTSKNNDSPESPLPDPFANPEED